MGYTRAERRWIYDRTGGHCHLCGHKLSFTNYGRHGERGAWEVEHSNPRSNGGTNRLSNLYAAHVTCNRAKGTRSTRSARGGGPAPESRDSRRRGEAAKAGAVIGGLLGLPFGPWGVAAGAAIGGMVGHDARPKPRAPRRRRSGGAR
jgi:hypothetical protein